MEKDPQKPRKTRSTFQPNGPNIYLAEAAPSLRYHRVESGRVSNEGEPWIWLRPSIRCLYVGTIPFIIIIYYRGLRERGRAPLLTRNRGCSRHTRRILSRSLPEAALPGIVLEFNSPPTRRRFRFPPRSFGFGDFDRSIFVRGKKKKKKEKSEKNFSSPRLVCLPKFDDVCAVTQSRNFRAGIGKQEKVSDSLWNRWSSRWARIDLLLFLSNYFESRILRLIV